MLFQLIKHTVLIIPYLQEKLHYEQQKNNNYSNNYSNQKKKKLNLYIPLQVLLS